MSEQSMLPTPEIPSNPRSEIVNSYLSTIEESFRSGRPQIKLINYGTGSGKTHQFFEAVCESIRKHENVHIIGIYVAPLREHLQAPATTSENKDIPFYTVNSLQMKTTDTLFKKYTSWLDKILGNRKFWNDKLINSPNSGFEEARSSLARVPRIIGQLEFMKRTDFGDEEFREKFRIKAIRELNNLIEKFLDFLIKNLPDETTWPDECLKLTKVFYPLYLLREKPGIIMLTYDKFETKIPFFIHNGFKWIKKNDHLDQFIRQQSDGNKRFILAFDEQEDGYQIVLNRKIDIISPRMLAINNALSSISREFSILFSEKEKVYREFLEYADLNPGVYHELATHLEKEKSIDDRISKYVNVFRELTQSEGNSIDFLRQVSQISKHISASINDVLDVCETLGDRNPVDLDFGMLSRVFSKFENNRSLLIPRRLYSKIADELMSIFSHNNLFIYNIEPLRSLFLAKSAGGHVYITDEPTADSASVAELIYAIFVIRLQIELIIEFLSNVLNAEDSQSRSLDIWSKQITKIQKASEEISTETRPPKYVNREYVYKSYKSIINIMEISRYQHPTNDLVNHTFREVSIGSTAILTSPEHKLHSILENGSNVLFLISATGGITGDLSTSYDMRYLEDILRDDSGKSSFNQMIETELQLCEQIRKYRKSTKHLSVVFFDANQSTYPNVRTELVAEQFYNGLLNGFIESMTGDGRWFGAYKKHELQNFFRFLFLLFEDDTIQNMIAFTQTLRWIKESIKYCRLRRHANFKFEPSPDHPNICYLKLEHKSFASNLRVKVILYDASFNAEYYSDDSGKTYLDELVECDGEKILFVSAYQSAAKGLNPIIKYKGDAQKDFDALALLMDSYYTAMGPLLNQPKDAGKATTLYHFALMKNIVHLGDTSVEIKDFNKYINNPDAESFRVLQHQILLGKGILQAIGRTERRDFPNQVSKIFINEETRKNLVNFYRYLNRNEPNEIRKLSVNNYEVYLALQKDEKSRCIPKYEEHEYDEVASYYALQEFREKMLEEIQHFHEGKSNAKIIDAWKLLRNPVVFSDPAAFLKKIEASKLFPADFIESLFYCRPSQLRFTPYLATITDGGRKIDIISDSVNGDKTYKYMQRLYPNFLKTASAGFDTYGEELQHLNQSSDAIVRLYRKLIPEPDIFNTYIPRPHFFYDVLLPSLAENFVEGWIKNEIFEGNEDRTIKSLYKFEQVRNFNKYNKLYELFDLYYTKESTLFCIDVKAWSRISGNRLSSKALKKSQKKLDKIATDYPAFGNVRGLLLNLYAPIETNLQHSPNLFSGNLIYTDSSRCPIASTILKDFLFCKEI
ncbi:MAG: hypothetical protein ACRBF0_14970 [Calditrichia bacterium]